MEPNKKTTTLEINPLFFGLQTINQANQINTPISKQ